MKTPTTASSSRLGLRSIRARLLIFLFVGISALIIVGTLVQINMMQTQMHDQIQRVLNEDYTTFNNDLALESQTAVTVAMSLADRADVRALVEAGDREGLVALMTPLFGALSREHGIQHLYFHDPTGTVIVRLHKPEQFGDNVTASRHSVADTAAEKIPHVGIELGANFLGLRGVAPILAGDRLVGMVETGIDIDKTFLQKLGQTSHADYTLWLLTSFADTTTFNYAERPFAAPIPELFYYSSSRAAPLTIDSQQYRKVFLTGTPYSTRLEDQGQAAAIFPLYNYDDRLIGVLGVSYSIEAFLTTLGQQQTSIILFSLILIALGLAIFWLIFSRLVLRPLQVIQNAMQRRAAGELDVRVTGMGDDELGVVAAVYNDLVSRVNDLLEKERLTVIEKEHLIRQLREASRVKAEFLATMSHELRTPLNAMIGFNELMRTGKSGALTDKQKHQLDRMHANSLRLLTLIDDVLDLSRIEAGRVEIAREEVVLSDVVHKIEEQTASLIEGKAFDFLVEIDPALPRMILGDRDRIEQIMLNLLSNAFKFTQQGEVHLSLKPAEAGRWQFSVRDTGIGIPAHALEYIFEEFRQVDGSSRRAYGGSGLGLAISRNLSRLMNGDIKVQSTVGVGTTFTVNLPLNLEDELSQLSQRQAVPAAKTA